MLYRPVTSQLFTHLPSIIITNNNTLLMIISANINIILLITKYQFTVTTPLHCLGLPALNHGLLLLLGGWGIGIRDLLNPFLPHKHTHTNPDGQAFNFQLFSTGNIVSGRMRCLRAPCRQSPAGFLCLSRRNTGRPRRNLFLEMGQDRTGIRNLEMVNGQRFLGFWEGYFGLWEERRKYRVKKAS